LLPPQSAVIVRQVALGYRKSAEAMDVPLWGVMVFTKNRGLGFNEELPILASS
jgi:hypothetical protein